LLSFGLGAEWTFETDYLRMTGRPITCYDHTVGARFWVRHAAHNLMCGHSGTLSKYLEYRRFVAQPGVEHRRIKIGYDAAGATSLDSIMKQRDPSDAILLKIDIEGWEYEILDQIVQWQDSFSGIVIEFHDVDTSKAKIQRFLDGLRQMRVVWIHGNNLGGTDTVGDPVVLEMALAVPSSDETSDMPHALDVPNNPDQPELPLAFSA
jgi:FkbM family methyltransferase